MRSPVTDEEDEDERSDERKLTQQEAAHDIDSQKRCTDLEDTETPHGQESG